MMSTGLMHRVVVFASFIAALAIFAYNMAEGGDILYSAFCALCVFMGLSIAMLIALQGVAKALLRHLKEKQRLHREAEMEALRKQMAKQQKDQSQGQA